MVNWELPAMNFELPALEIEPLDLVTAVIELPALIIVFPDFELADFELSPPEFDFEFQPIEKWPVVEYPF